MIKTTSSAAGPGSFIEAVRSPYGYAHFALWVAAAAALGLVALALREHVYLLRLFNQGFLNLVILLGFLIILGFSKQFSLAQVAFYGIGAYGYAYLSARLGLSFFPALILAALLASLAASLLALLASRFEGPWLALVTLAFAEIIRLLMTRAKPITGGSGGFYNIPRPEIFGWQLTSEFDYFLLYMPVALLALFVTVKLRFSPYGRLWFSIGDNESIPKSLGVNVVHQKVLVFAIGSFFSGLAGALFSSYSTFISPESFGLSHTVHYLTMLVLGGLESIIGVVLSAIFFTILNNYLISLHPWDLILEGLIIVVCLNVMPQGIGGSLGQWLRRISNGGAKNSDRA